MNVFVLHDLNVFIFFSFIRKFYACGCTTAFSPSGFTSDFQFPVIIAEAEQLNGFQVN